MGHARTIGQTIILHLELTRRNSEKASGGRQPPGYVDFIVIVHDPYQIRECRHFRAIVNHQATPRSPWLFSFLAGDC
jgi:hypothetical protein